MTPRPFLGSDRAALGVLVLAILLLILISMRGLPALGCDPLSISVRRLRVAGSPLPWLFVAGAVAFFLVDFLALRP